MLRPFVVCAFLGLVIASPAVMRSRKDIEAFQQFLDNIKNGNENGERFLSRKNAYPLATVEEMSGKFQGDIVLDDGDYEIMLQEYVMGRNSYKTSSITIWPENTVVFEFGDGEFDDSQKAAVWEAVRDIEARTCVKFRYRESTDSVYVKLTGESSGCYAHIGHRLSRGAHTMNLARDTVGSGCFRHATIVHEWMHILGFLHMHTTYDRDEYVKIIEENIIPGSEYNFDIYTEARVDNLNVDYDYLSCLHYGPYSFTVNGQPTIVALKNFTGEMGQRQYVTDNDWLRINRNYNCPGAWD